MLKDKLAHYTLILASNSARRQQFFSDLNLDFEIRIKDVEEIYPPELKGVEITNYLAIHKANAFEGTLKANEILITGDTIVWHNNTALGKPKNKKEAFTILKSLSNTTHEVISSVCFKTKDKLDVVYGITKVTFDYLDDELIEYYLENYNPYDKAGSYGIQEWFGFVGITKIEGSCTNVMGMPTDKVFAYLRNLST